MSETMTEMPTFIERDTYDGPWTARRNPSTVKSGVFTAGEIAAMAPTGAMWVYFGLVNGRSCFGRNRYVAAPNGDLHVYNADGSLCIVHPAGRKLRLLTK